jgi:hypothetical protein
MNAPINVQPPTQDDLAVAEYGSLYRVLEQAPIENRGSVFFLMASRAASDVDIFRQNMIDGLWEVAVETGLVRLVGTATVLNAVAIAFDGSCR